MSERFKPISSPTKEPMMPDSADNLVVTQEGFVPCPLCKQYCPSIGGDQLADAFNHFQSMFSHRGDGIPTQFSFDAKTRDAAQVLVAAARHASSARREGLEEAAKDGEDALFFERVAETVKELDGVGFWNTCSGCHESEDGYDVGHYPYSPSFNCKLGGGCSECGGIGAIWDTTDYDAMAREMLAEDREASPIANAEERDLEAEARELMAARVQAILDQPSHGIGANRIVGTDFLREVIKALSEGDGRA